MIAALMSLIRGRHKRRVAGSRVNICRKDTVTTFFLVAPLRQVIASTSGEPKIPDQYSVPAYSQAKKTPKIAIFPTT
jgi:hypothetical protein